MKSLIYIYKQSLYNRFKHAVRKPVFYLYAVAILGYIIMMASFLIQFVYRNKVNQPEYLVMFLSAFLLITGPQTYISYAKKKGLIYYPSDVHFIFTSPISPKQVLIYALAKTLFFGLLAGIFVFGLGVIVFGVPVWNMLFCFLIITVIDGVLQGSLVITLYGNERFSANVTKNLARLLWIFVIALVGIIFYIFYKDGFSLVVFTKVISSPIIQCIPIFGWGVAAIRLAILGPTTLNMICTVLYLGFTVLLFVLAYKMKCTGKYYEEAMTFADDYQEARAKSKKGQVAVVGKKTKYKKAHIQYKGNGAKAIFYRQLLEYKKNKFFIFGIPSLLFLGCGIGFAYLYSIGEIEGLGQMKYYMVPLIMMYLNLVFSGYQTKWEKELESPYTYLIPDIALKKMWYATLMEHVRSLFDGLFLSIPIVLILEFPFWYIILYTVVNVCVNAIKIYSGTVCEVILGNVLGKTAKTLLRMIIMWTAIGVAVPIVAFGTFAINTEIGMLLGVGYMVILLIGLIAAGAFAFSKMEMQGIPE